jgi:hypothetical protein
VSLQQPDAVERQPGAGDVVAGFLAAAAIAVAAIGVAYRPVRLGVPAIVIALVAAGMARGRTERLAGVAVALTTACWVAGMIVAVLSSNPLW